LDDPGLRPDPNGDQTVYLIPNFESDEEAQEILEDLFADVFERELWDWHTDEEAWPHDRDFRMFQEWFSVEFHSVVEDLCDDEILDDEE
jgi:hypothetical protein